MPVTVRDRIIRALESLSNEQRLKFKHKLSERKVIGYGLIENEGPVQITQRIVSKLTVKRAIAFTADILREIGSNDEAADLENDGDDCQETPVAAGAGGARPAVTGEAGEQAEGIHFVDKNQIELINRVVGVKAILDQLLQKKFISYEMYSLIGAEKTNEDQMRKLLYDVIIRIGVSAKDELVRVLEKEDPHLMDSLRGK